MFVTFAGTNEKQVRIDPTAVLAVAELESGSRIHIGSSIIAVKESADAVLAELESIEESGDEEEDED